MNQYKHIEIIQQSGLFQYTEQYLTTMLVIGLSEHTHRRHQSALRSLILWCDHQDISELHHITKETLTAYRNYLYEYRKSNGDVLTKGSLNSKLTPLKKFIEWCSKEGFIDEDFAYDLAIPKKPRGIPTKILMHETVSQILQQPDTKSFEGLRDRAILEVLYSTAIRRSEITYLKIQDIDFQRRTLKINHAKNGQDRFVPICHRALRWVKRYLRTARPRLLIEADDDILFLSRSGDAFQPGTLASRVKGYIRSAGIDTRGACHLFRHSVATQMLENGADIRYIQSLLGHVDLNTTEIYTRVAINKLKVVHEKTHPMTHS
ncbi:MAG: tyrosine-type recombinase/integrase [Gammaproteobacteria bacterium]